MLVYIRELSEMTKKFVTEKNFTLIKDIDEAEDRIDAMRKKLLNDHIARLNSGECKPESSSVFINLVCNLERVGDHVNYIAHTYIDL